MDQYELGFQAYSIKPAAHPRDVPANKEAGTPQSASRKMAAAHRKDNRRRSLELVNTQKIAGNLMERPETTNMNNNKNNRENVKSDGVIKKLNISNFDDLVSDPDARTLLKLDSNTKQSQDKKSLDKNVQKNIQKIITVQCNPT